MFGKDKKDDDYAEQTVLGADGNVPNKSTKTEVVYADNESLTSDHTLVAQQEGIQPIFVAKCSVLNKALADIGMGRYQWELFFAGGFGWFADNIWLQIVAILQPAIGYEWAGVGGQTHDTKFMTLALYAGLIVGASFWGCSADIIGRKLAWNSTLFVGGIFGVAAGAAPNFVALCCLIACMGFGVGGNLPVDGTMYLEFLPGTHQWLLTLLSLWWAVGQLVASLVAWAFLARWGCTEPEGWPESGNFCTKESNMGWRYSYYTLGAMMLFLWFGRMFILPVYESPKFLITIGKDNEAVDVINKVAKRNGSPVRITIDDLKRAAEPYLTLEEKERGEIPETKFSIFELLRNSVSELSLSHVKPLFATRRLAYSTSLIVACYGAVGLAYPLFFSFLGTYLASRNGETGATTLDATYASYTYQAACGVPGSMLAAWLVTWNRAGRKFAMAFFTIMTGVFLLALTAGRTAAAINALTCMGAFFANAFYGVMYGYAPELFPTPSRGTGDAMCAAFNRITGLMAPIIAIYSQAKETPNGPVFASGGIFIATGIAMMFLPVETRGRTAL